METGGSNDSKELRRGLRQFSAGSTAQCKYDRPTTESTGSHRWNRCNCRRSRFTTRREQCDASRRSKKLRRRHQNADCRTGAHGIGRAFDCHCVCALRREGGYNGCCISVLLAARPALVRRYPAANCSRGARVSGHSLPGNSALRSASIDGRSHAPADRSLPGPHAR